MTALSTLSDATYLSTTLAPEQAVAVLARALAREGYRDHNAGHITYRLDEGTFLLNPWDVVWEVTRASDILRVGSDGQVLQGRGVVTPAVELHLALHRARPDVKVAIHNHPVFTLIWAAIGEVPPAYGQAAALVAEADIAIYDEYAGGVQSRAIAERNVAALGDKFVALLRNHGVLVVGETLQRAYARAVSIEWRCRLATQVHQVAPDRARPLSADAAAGLTQLLTNAGSEPHEFPQVWWEAACQTEVRLDPSVLQ